MSGLWDARMRSGRYVGHLGLTRGAGDAVPPEPSLPPRAVARIGERLRAYYAEMVAEPVPERFTELLGRVDERNRPGSNSAS